MLGNPNGTNLYKIPVTWEVYGKSKNTRDFSRGMNCQRTYVEL